MQIPSKYELKKDLKSAAWETAIFAGPAIALLLDSVKTEHKVLALIAAAGAFFIRRYLNYYTRRNAGK